MRLNDCSSSDYQAVAKENPLKLSQAIQEGIPDVIRGSMWQLSQSFFICTLTIFGPERSEY